jgi:hypothetical protein
LRARYLGPDLPTSTTTVKVDHLADFLVEMETVATVN